MVHLTWLRKSAFNLSDSCLVKGQRGQIERPGLSSIRPTPCVTTLTIPAAGADTHNSHAAPTPRTLLKEMAPYSSPACAVSHLSPGLLATSGPWTKQPAGHPAVITRRTQYSSLTFKTFSCLKKIVQQRNCCLI